MEVTQQKGEAAGQAQREWQGVQVDRFTVKFWIHSSEPKFVKASEENVSAVKVDSDHGLKHLVSCHILPHPHLVWYAYAGTWISELQHAYASLSRGTLSLGTEDTNFRRLRETASVWKSQKACDEMETQKWEHQEEKGWLGQITFGYNLASFFCFIKLLLASSFAVLSTKNIEWILALL